MTRTEILKVLAEQDRAGRHVFTVHELAKLLYATDQTTALKATLQRMTRDGLLIRGAKGIYVNALSRHLGENTIELVAKQMRRGEYNYISLESALSAYGLISQIPVDRLTLMTTGRSGEYRTPFGVIEFVHTKRPLSVLLDSMIVRERPLRFATKAAALRDLRRVGRNTHLIDEQACNETEY